MENGRRQDTASSLLVSILSTMQTICGLVTKHYPFSELSSESTGTRQMLSSKSESVYRFIDDYEESIRRRKAKMAD